MGTASKCYVDNLVDIDVEISDTLFMSGCTILAAQRETYRVAKDSNMAY